MAAASPSVAGIISASNDASRRVIPTSVRADGSLRKERAVKPGYVPVEDVARFKPGQGRLRDQLAAAQARFEAPASPSPAGNNAAATPLPRIKAPADFVPRERPVYPKFEKRAAPSDAPRSEAPATPSNKPVTSTMDMTAVKAALPSTTVSVTAPTSSHKTTSSFSSGASRSRWASAPAEPITSAVSTPAPPVPSTPALPPPRSPSPARSTASTRSVSSARGAKNNRNKHKTPPHSPPQNNRRAMQSNSTSAMSMDELSSLMNRLGPVPVQQENAPSTPVPSTSAHPAAVSTPMPQSVTTKPNKRGDRPSRRGRGRGAPTAEAGPSSGPRTRQPIAALDTAVAALPGSDQQVDGTPAAGTSASRPQESPSIALPDLSGTGDWWSDSDEDGDGVQAAVSADVQREITEREAPTSTSLEPAAPLNDSGFMPKEAQVVGSQHSDALDALDPPAVQTHERHSIPRLSAAPAAMTLADIRSQAQYLAYNIRSMRFTSSRLSDEEAEQARGMQGELAALRETIRTVYVDVEQAWNEATAPVDDEEL